MLTVLRVDATQTSSCCRPVLPPSVDHIKLLLIWLIYVCCISINLYLWVEIEHNHKNSYIRIFYGSLHTLGLHDLHPNTWKSELGNGLPNMPQTSEGLGTVGCCCGTLIGWWARMSQHLLVILRHLMLSSGDVLLMQANNLKQMSESWSLRQDCWGL